MTATVDTSVLIDVLCGVDDAVALLRAARGEGPLHGSEITRTEVLAGMRPPEEDRTRRLLAGLVWHPVDETISEEAGRLGRAWVPRRPGISAADLVIAATARAFAPRLLTTNVKHFPMFDSLRKPY